MNEGKKEYYHNKSTHKGKHSYKFSKYINSFCYNIMQPSCSSSSDFHTLIFNIVILLLPILVKYVFFILVSHMNIIPLTSVYDNLIPFAVKFHFVFIKNTPIIYKIYPEIRYSNRLLWCFIIVKCFFVFLNN